MKIPFKKKKTSNLSEVDPIFRLGVRGKVNLGFAEVSITNFG
jgi:hypothetical protein